MSCSTTCTCSGRPVAYPGTNEKSAANCLVWGSVKAQVLVIQSLQVLCMALSRPLFLQWSPKDATQHVIYFFSPTSARTIRVHSLLTLEPSMWKKPRVVHVISGPSQSSVNVKHNRHAKGTSSYIHLALRITSEFRYLDTNQPENSQLVQQE